jgi:RNA polymerase sigma-70 factor, ECF subfamily
MPLEPVLRDDMLAAMPGLRAFAISLCRNGDQADDLVQETLLRACTSIKSFSPGTNMGAWLHTILRNHFCSERRKRRKRLESIEAYVGLLATKPTQIAHTEYRDVCRALAKLPPVQREALILVGAAGLSYEEAAQACGCPAGTIKSRVRRGRADLAQLTGIAAEDFVEDPIVGAVIAASTSHVRVGAV